MTTTLELLRRLQEENVEFVCFDGTLGGKLDSSTTIGLCVSWSEVTWRAVFRALSEVAPQPAEFEAPMLAAQEVRVMCGQVEFLFVPRLPGLGDLAEVIEGSMWLTVGNVRFRVLRRETLVVMHRARGGSRDLELAEELEARIARMRAPSP